jgi:tight adherence protein B
VTVRQQPSADSIRLDSTLSAPLSLAYGTHIYDAVMRSFAVLEASHVSSGSVVLLSDGADLGSAAKLSDVVARAARDHFRVFTVGLRSGAYDARTLQQLAAGTGGVYTEAASSSDLGRIYRALSGRLANEYLLQYRSSARPGERVEVSVDIPTLGSATAAYVTPTASGLAPFHRSPITRFMLSGASVVILTLIVAGLVAFVLRLLLRRPEDSLLERMGTFVALHQPGSSETQAAQLERTRRVRAPARPSSAFGRWRARLATDFEIAEISIAPSTFLLATATLTVLAAVVLLLISPPFVLLAVLVPVFARAWVARKVGAVRFAFEQQLPETLQVLASALRSGHSFFGALGLVVDSCSQPSRREFRQVLTDDQLGIPVEEALRHVAVRMASRDMEQVALLGELQRTAGGNSAEVLDTVVETIRERTDLRRLAQTLTAQGRMARWILSFLPPVVALFLWISRPDLIDPLFQSKNGQIALAVTALMSVGGSFWIKQIVNIKV